MGIRVTNSMMMANFLSNLNANMSRMDKYSTQMASNKRINRLADDPVGLLTATQSRSQLYKMEHMQRNLTDAKAVLQKGETSLMEFNTVLQRAYELAMDASTDAKTPENRKLIAEEIAQIRDHLLGLANSTSNDKYIFGGFNTTQKPFTVNAAGVICYNGMEMTAANLADLQAADEKLQEYFVNFGDVKVEVSIGGLRLMGGVDGENVYTMLDNLYNELMSGTSVATDIGKYIDPLQKMQSHFLAVTADYGGRNNRLDMFIARLDSDYGVYTERMSKAEDAEQEEVIMKWKMAEAVYQSSLAVGARVIQPTLMDYLR